MAWMTAAEAAVRVLEREGVTQTFGVPGAAINPFYSAMRAHGGIRHVLARHVEGASHMADGYSRAEPGNIGVCIGTSGPAGTDMITGLYAAWADSVPMLCITGQAPVAKLDKEDFQAVDIASIAKPVTKMAKTVLEGSQVPGVFAEAFRLMRSGRPGPVLLDLPIDVQLTQIDFDPDTYEPLLPAKPAATAAQVQRALDMLQAAERPLIIAGGGVLNARAEALLVQLAETLDVPVVPTLMGWGVIPDDHRLAAGMVGLQTAQRYGNATFLAQALELATARRAAGQLPDRSAWVETAAQNKRTLLRKTHFTEVPIKPQRVYEEMNRAFGRDTVYVTTIGLSQIAGAQLLHVYRPRHWINAGQAGPLGWTGPAALGVAAAKPGTDVVALSGDYDFQFMLEELAVGAQHQLPYVHVVVNNAYLGLIRQSQRAFEMDYQVSLAFENINAGETEGYGVDHVKVAEALGCKALRVFDPGELESTFVKARAMASELRVPVVVEVILERVTNISMGVELDGVNEFEALAISAADSPTAIALLD